MPCVDEATGAVCHPEFLYDWSFFNASRTQGRTHLQRVRGCTMLDGSEQPWCPTEVDSDGVYTNGSRVVCNGQCHVDMSEAVALKKEFITFNTRLGSHKAILVFLVR